CTTGTRETVLSNVKKWAMDASSEAPASYWIVGMTGTGKSTIVKSVCEVLEKNGQLGASFFCSKQIPECNKYNLVIPTIAYQLASYSRTFAETLIELLKTNPDVCTRTPAIQLEKLLVNPWKTAAKSTFLHPIVIVIDAVNEC
ncbi:hypothetical protein K435DRAFT_633412, partial [Dendrothele bispora CBS 962.96]